MPARVSPVAGNILGREMIRTGNEPGFQNGSPSHGKEWSAAPREPSMLTVRCTRRKLRIGNREMG